MLDKDCFIIINTETKLTELKSELKPTPCMFLEYDLEFVDRLIAPMVRYYRFAH